MVKRPDSVNPLVTAMLFLKFRNVEYSVAGKAILNIPEFELMDSGLTLLSGRNGAGKTTFLKILAGLLTPDSTQVEGDGKSVMWKAARDRYRKQIVYLHQRPYLFDRSVRDNVAYGLRRRGVGGEALRQQVDHALTWAGLEHLAQRNARQLSGGEQQRVALTRARVLSPRVLLLDEPLTGMDNDARDQSRKLIKTLSRDKLGIVMTSHEAAQGMTFAERCFDLIDGCLHDCTARTVVAQA